jgi:hypothetical protein
MVFITLILCVIVFFAGCGGSDAGTATTDSSVSQDSLSSGVSSSSGVPSSLEDSSSSQDSSRYGGFARLEGLPRFVVDAPPPRFHEGPVTEFIPMDYGKILPFLGQQNQTEWYMTAELFGFIDAGGRIICDPVFSAVEKLTYGDRYAFVATSHWLEGGTASDASWWSNIESFKAVITSNGSFFGKFDDVYTGDFFLESNHEFIPVKRGDKWGLIDFDGNQILPFEYPNAPLFSDGLAAVFEWAGYEWMWEYFQNNVPFYYIDIAGNMVLGPFEPPPMVAYVEPFALHLEAVRFFDGLAMNFKDEEYGFIDRAGRVVIPHRYLFTGSGQIGWNEAGLALVVLPETREEFLSEWGHTEQIIASGLIDREGNLIVQMPLTYIWGGVNSHSGIYTVTGLDWNLTAAFDFAGNEIPAYGGHHMGNGYFITWSTNFADGSRVSGNGVNRSFEHGVSAQWLFGDWFSINVDFRTANAIDTGEYLMWNARTGEERHGLAPQPSWRSSVPNRYILVTTWDWERDNLFGVFDGDANVIIDMKFNYLTSIGENYFAIQGRHGGLLDSNGEWIIRVRLTGNFD